MRLSNSNRVQCNCSGTFAIQDSLRFAFLKSPSGINSPSRPPSILVILTTPQRINTISKINSHDALRFTNEFSTSTDALEFLEENNTDLIFLEIDTPNLNGFEFLDLIKTTGKKMPKVIITTKNTDYAFKSYRYDVVDFLAKPLNESLFQNAIDKVLKVKSPLVQDTETDTQHILIKTNLKIRKV